MRTLDPNDPIDMEAMRELDALTPAVPSMIPQPPPEELLKRFVDLEEREERAAADYRRRARERDTALTIVLGHGYWPREHSEEWISADGTKVVSREELLRSEGRGWSPLPSARSPKPKP